MRKQVRRLALLAATAVLLLVLVGFTAKPSSPRLGAYTMSVAVEDIPSSVPDEVRSNFVGKWEMTFAKGNKYRISKDNNVIIEGRFAATKERLTLTDEKGVLACTQQPGIETGIYKWSYKGKKLIFTTVEDGCPGRQYILTLRSWLREK